MQNRRYQSQYIYFLVIAVFMVGNLTVESFAASKKNHSDDVQSTALPGQIAPRLQNLGNKLIFKTTWQLNLAREVLL